MALVQFGGGITKMSGSIAGNTFARNRSGNYVRSRTKPVNPNTGDQVKVRSAVSYLTEYWRDTLSAAQRIAWNLYGTNVAMKNKLGETIKLSGFNHFIRGNATRVCQLRPVVPAGPTDFTLPAKDETIVIDVDESPQQISVTWDDGRAWCDETFAFLHMRQGIPQNGVRNFFAGPYHNVGIVHGSEIPWTPPWLVQPHYPVAAGQHQWCAFRIYRADGRVSEIFYADAITHGQAPGEVPMLLGQTQTQAEALLANASLILGTVTTANSNQVPIDRIMSSDPVAHERLNVGDAVNIVVSLGPSEGGEEPPP